MAHTSQREKRGIIVLCRDTIQTMVSFKETNKQSSLKACGVAWRGVADSFILEKVEAKREASRKERNKRHQMLKSLLFLSLLPSFFLAAAAAARVCASSSSLVISFLFIFCLSRDEKKERESLPPEKNYSSSSRAAKRKAREGWIWFFFFFLSSSPSLGYIYTYIFLCNSLLFFFLPFFLSCTRNPLFPF